MKLVIKQTAAETSRQAAVQVASLLNDAIAEHGTARILLSTGASQFLFFEALVEQSVDWSRVEMFHLDEYLGISDSHPASFKRYLVDRFVSKVPIAKAHLMDGTRPAEETIAELTALLAESPIDVGVIGIGENAHIAFNDPPADFETDAAYKVVTLDERCLMQQVGEGWFASVDETYKQAITMTCRQIIKCRSIVSVVPYSVKAEAVSKALTSEMKPEVPATYLFNNPAWTLYLDAESAALLSEGTKKKYL